MAGRRYRAVPAHRVISSNFLDHIRKVAITSVHVPDTKHENALLLCFSIHLRRSTSDVMSLDCNLNDPTFLIHRKPKKQLHCSDVLGLQSVLNVEDHLALVDTARQNAKSDLHAHRDSAKLFDLVFALGAKGGLVTGPELQTTLREVIRLALGAGAAELLRLFGQQDYTCDRNAEFGIGQQVLKSTR